MDARQLDWKPWPLHPTAGFAFVVEFYRSLRGMHCIDAKVWTSSRDGGGGRALVCVYSSTESLPLNLSRIVERSNLALSGAVESCRSKR